jgi:hypothetical protein
VSENEELLKFLGGSLLRNFWTLETFKQFFLLQLRTLDNFNSPALLLRARRDVEHLRRSAHELGRVQASPLVLEVCGARAPG